MRTLKIAFILSLIVFPASAMSLTDYEAMPVHERSVYVVDYIEKITAHLSEKNPAKAQEIRDWFSQKEDGKPVSEGIERLGIELTALDLLAKDGKVDLSQIQVEGVIVKIIKDKFPPPPAQ